jgi:hypothetical protein
MTFRKGYTPWNKNKTNCYSKEVLESNRKKHSKSYEERYGKERAQEVKDKIRIKLQQRRLTDIHKQRIGLKSLGNKRAAGRIITDKYRQKISFALKGKPKSDLHKKNLSGNKNGMFGIRGPAHPSWLGGKKFEPYTHTFNKHFKQFIRSRDNYCCVKCGMFNEDHKKLFDNQSLDVHHINYDKTLSIPENCCALCKRCNNEVNYNREQWITFFQSILTERYGYVYNKQHNIIQEVIFR